MYISLGSWREFSCSDDANAWRKSTKEADKHKNFYCNLESKNLSMHWHHHLTNSHQSTSAVLKAPDPQMPAFLVQSVRLFRC